MSDSKDFGPTKTFYLKILIEMLYMGLRKNNVDKDILGFLKDKNAEGYADNYRIYKVDREADHDAPI